MAPERTVVCLKNSEGSSLLEEENIYEQKTYIFKLVNKIAVTISFCFFGLFGFSHSFSPICSIVGNSQLPAISPITR